MLKEIDTPFDRLEKIDRMLYWNQNKIDTAKNQLSTYHIMDIVFFKIDEIKNRIYFYKNVRIRLLQYRNRHLDLMKEDLQDSCINCKGWDEEIASRIGDYSNGSFVCPECGRKI